MLLTLQEAAIRIRPDGLVSPRSLRAEIAAGRLAGHRIAGRLLVSEEDITAYLDRARICSAPAARQKPAKPVVAAVRPAATSPQSKPAIPGPLAAAAAALTKRGTGKRGG